jgi:hypothetical protein
LPAVRKSKQANNKTQSKKMAAHQWLESKPEPKIVEKTAVSRRAKRRGYLEDESVGVEDTVVARSGKNQTVSMSKEEFAALDAALSNNDA